MKILTLGVFLGVVPLVDGKERKLTPVPPLEAYLQALDRETTPLSRTPGSLHTPGGRMADLGRDLRAVFAGDVVTVIVSDRATAIARGSTNANRSSDISAGVQAALGPIRAAGPLGQLAGAKSETSLNGTGETSRTMQLSTTVTAVVERLLPNGNLLLRGSKSIGVNSERQVVEIRGVVRPEDLLAGNQVLSDRVALLDIQVNGKGVVGDAVRRPMLLYRILMGLLPF